MPTLQTGQIPTCTPNLRSPTPERIPQYSRLLTQPGRVSAKQNHSYRSVVLNELAEIVSVEKP